MAWLSIYFGLRRLLTQLGTGEVTHELLIFLVENGLDNCLRVDQATFEPLSSVEDWTQLVRISFVVQ